MSVHTQILPLSQLREYFPQATMLLVLESIEQGHTAAAAWQISKQNHSISILWEQANNTIYYQYLPEDAELIQACQQHLYNTIQPQSLARHAPYFKTSCLSPCPPERLEQITQGHHGHWFEYQLYTYPTSQPPYNPTSQIALYTINADLLANNQLAEREALIDEICGMWGNINNFLQHGFGSVAITNNTIASFCTAEFLGHTRCGIGIATHPQYQNQGFATATASHMIQQALARNLIPHWECRTSNQASVRLAEKLGFQLIKQSHYWGGAFGQAN